MVGVPTEVGVVGVLFRRLFGRYGACGMSVAFIFIHSTYMNIEFYGTANDKRERINSDALVRF